MQLIVASTKYSLSEMHMRCCALGSIGTAEGEGDITFITCTKRAFLSPKIDAFNRPFRIKLLIVSVEKLNNFALCEGVYKFSLHSLSIP